MYLTYANSSLPSYKSLQHWSSVIMEKMNLILELQNRQTLYYDTSLNYYEAEQKQPRTFSCLKFNKSDLSSQVSIGSLKKKTTHYLVQPWKSPYLL